MKNTLTKNVIGGVIRACLCGALTGSLTALVIVLYKICAKFAISFSNFGYSYIREHIYLLPIVILIFVGIALFLSYIYRKNQNVQGGGIPTSIGIIRGYINFSWFKNLIGTFFLSLLTFVIGVPLGNEGPSVQMGTAIGRGITRAFPKSKQGLDRYAMTGGACAGFSSATGAPISGILFAVEEAHGQFSPLVLLVCSVAVFSGRAVTEIVSPIFNVSISLFPSLQPTVLSVYNLWLPILVGVIVGLFSVLFLRYYRVLHSLLNRILRKCHKSILIFTIFALTLFAGLFSFSFISTGHELILELFHNLPLLTLIILLLVRTTLTLSANASGITGGVFIPILTLGALVSVIISSVLKITLDLSDEYCLLVLLFGITACIASSMKMPLTAIVFAVEVLSCQGNLLSVIAVSTTAFAITELFGVHSINDYVLERKLEELNSDKTAEVYDTYVTVQPKSFAVGKQIRDVLWPAGLFILSVQHNEKFQSKNGKISGNVLQSDDILHIRYSTFNQKETHSQLIALVGEQQYNETQIDVT